MSAAPRLHPSAGPFRVRSLAQNQDWMSPTQVGGGNQERCAGRHPPCLPSPPIISSHDASTSIFLASTHASTSDIPVIFMNTLQVCGTERLDRAGVSLSWASWRERAGENESCKTCSARYFLRYVFDNILLDRFICLLSPSFILLVCKLSL